MPGFWHGQGARSARKLYTHCCSAEQQQGPDISKLSPLQHRQWDHIKNAHLGNIRITPGSNRIVWWTCDQCPDGHKHEWCTKVNSRSYGSACPFCAHRKLCQHNSLATLAPAVAAEFSSDNKMTAHDYMCSSKQSVLWQCEKGHEWYAEINARTSGRRKTGCPECCNLSKSQPRKRCPVLTDIQHPMMQYWDWELNNIAGFDPSKLTCKSNRKVNWICQCCPKGQPHRWQAPVSTLYARHGCPCCTGRKPCICNSLQALFPNIAAEWDYSMNKGIPSDYTAFSIVRVWWSNPKRGLFEARISDRTYNYKAQLRRGFSNKM